MASALLLMASALPLMSLVSCRFSIVLSCRQVLCQFVGLLCLCNWSDDWEFSWTHHSSHRFWYQPSSLERSSWCLSCQIALTARWCWVTGCHCWSSRLWCSLVQCPERCRQELHWLERLTSELWLLSVEWWPLCCFRTSLCMLDNPMVWMADLYDVFAKLKTSTSRIWFLRLRIDAHHLLWICPFEISL